MIADEFPALWGLAVATARQRGAVDPENVAAEALTRCWQAEQQRGAIVRHAYLYRAVINQTITERRQRWTTDAPLDFEPVVAWSPDGGAVADVLAELTPGQAHVAAALAAGWANYEIAAALGIDHSAVVQRRQRAARRLERLGY